MRPPLVPVELTQNEMVIQRLYGITSHYEAGFEPQMEELLRLAGY